MHKKILLFLRLILFISLINLLNFINVKINILIIFQ